MIKTHRTKRTFSPEFKLEAIEQVVKYQRDAREVAQALELNPDHLRKWIRLYKQELLGIEPTGNAITPEQREIQQLKAQIKRLEMEKEILKQADERSPRKVIALITRLKAFHALSRGAAGSRAISQMLRQNGVDAGRWLARRLMQECGLTSSQPLKHRYRMN